MTDLTSAELGQLPENNCWMLVWNVRRDSFESGLDRQQSKPRDTQESAKSQDRVEGARCTQSLASVESKLGAIVEAVLAILLPDHQA